MANTKLPARLLDTSAIPALNVTGDLTVDTTTLKVDSTNNRVGIGIASPLFPLHINSSSTDVAKFQTSGSYTYTRFQNSSKTWALSVGSDFGFYDEAASATRMLIDSSGKVGIGTTFPAHGLTVSDIDGGDDANMRRITIKSETHGVNSGFRFDSESANGTARASGYYFQPGDTDATTYLGLSATDGAYQMVITREGNVGIGLDNPGAKLEVADSDGGISVFINNTQSWSAANLSEFNNTALVINPRANGAQLRFSGSGGDVRIQSLTSDLSTAEDISLNPFGGNVGIGTSSPNAKLHVQTSHTQTDVTGANSNSTLNIANSGSGNGVYNAIKFAANQQDMYIMSFNNNQQASRRIGFFLGSVAGDATTDERLSILGNGNVGIGDTSPGAKLSVGAGNASTYVHINNASSGDVSSGYNIMSGSTTTTSLYGNADEGWTTLLSGGALNFRVNNASSGFNPMGIDTSGTVRMTKGGTAFTPLQYDGLVIQSHDATGIRIIDAGNGGGNGGHCGIGNDNGNLVVSTAGVMMFDTGFEATDQLYNGRITRMQIDSNGRVTMPYQPTWGASSLSNTSSGGGTTAGGTLVFSGVLNNNGNHYSNSTGLFTAPVAGQYFVTFSGLYDDSYSVTGPAYIRRNTSNLYRGYHQNSGSSYLQISMSGVVECSVGDSISIYSAMAGWHIGGETSFSGFLIG